MNNKKFSKKIGNDNDLKMLCKRYKNIKLHISPELIRKLGDMEQTEIIWKPRGLWFGVGCVWLDFMINEMGREPCCYIYQIITNDKIKKIKSPKEMYQFGNENIDGDDVRVYQNYQTGQISKNFNFDSENKKFVKGKSSLHVGYNVHINWPVVAQKYNGIEVNVTTKEWNDDGRLHNRWFVGWDIPSGAIWKFDNVTVKLIFHKKNNVWYQVNDIVPNVKYEFVKLKNI